MKKFIVSTGDKKYKVEANTYDEAVSAVKIIKSSIQNLEEAIKIEESKKSSRKAYDPNFVSALKQTLLSVRKVAREVGINDSSNTVAVTLSARNSRRCTYDASHGASQLDVIQALVTDEQAAIAAYTIAIKNLDGKVDPQYIEVLRNILKEENKHVENLQAIITGNVTEKNVEDSVKDAMSADDLERYLQQQLNNRNIELVAEAYTAANKPVAAYGDGSKTTAASIEHFAKSVGYANVKQERVDGMWVCWVGVTE